MQPDKLRVLLCYKNFGAFCGISHIGLGVSAMNAAKVLHQLGIACEILPMKEQWDLRKHLNLTKSKGKSPYTHVIVSAPWITTPAFSQLCSMFPSVQFAMCCHSNVGFLQADSRGIELLREGLALESGVQNFHVAANSERLCDFVTAAYGDPCTYIPNLYYVDHVHRHGRRLWSDTGGTLRIGIFGATRSLKNILSAVGAAIVISRSLKSETEVWVNVGRADGPEVKTILRAVANLTAGLPNLTVKNANWASWPAFRKTVGNMHLLLQPSYTESFNMVTADGCAEGVPSVVSSAVTWAPAGWRADVDDVADIARVGVGLIHDPTAAHRGLAALRAHNRAGVRAWMTYLSSRGQFDPLEATV